MKDYLTSKQVKEVLKINDCDLMHLRHSGKLKYSKKGNAYLYELNSIISTITIKK